MAVETQSRTTLTAESILKGIQSKQIDNNSDQPENETKLDTDSDSVMKDALRNIPRGNPKSGRKWKTTREERYSTSMKLDKTLKTSWNVKMQIRAQRKSVKAYEKELKDAKNKKQEEKRKRQQEHKKRKEEMERKSEIVQTIRDTRKIKKMKKSQLRTIEKR